MMIKPWVKLLLVKAGIRNQNFGSCFGSYTEKYEEYLRWFSQAIKLDGEVLEFGVASGGTTCLMAQALNEAKTPKTIHSFDSFTGFNPDEFDKSYALGDVSNFSEKFAWKTTEFSLNYVKSKLSAYGLSKYVNLHPGYFQDTLEPFLAQKPEDQYCFALIDCDLASSVQFCAETIYQNVTPGGVILFDDYASMVPGKPHTAYSTGVQTVVHKFVDEFKPSAHGYVDGLYHFVKQA